MRFYQLRDWILKQIDVKTRLQPICLWFILSLMVESRKHSLTFAAELSGLTKAQFSKFLKNNNEVNAHTLESLSKKQAKVYAKVIKKIKGLPWKIVIIVDSTLQSRSSLKSDNVKKFNHGQGFVVGHQWTNIILVINDIIIPLVPIPFYSKSYCRKNKLEYKTEHERVIEYLKALNLEEYIGSYEPSDVVVIADSGYDDKNIEKTILDKKWDFIIALKSSRGVKSETQYKTTKKSSSWHSVKDFFKKQRRLAWETIRLFSVTDTRKKKREDFRIRHTITWLKGVGKVHLVCSERRLQSRQKRKFIACSNLAVTPEQLLKGYKIRWKIEIFHKHVKMNLGFENVATKHFSAVESHVYLVYCAYILLNANPPGIPESSKALFEKQQYLAGILENNQIASILQQLTQIGGVERFKDELKSALTSGNAHKPLFGAYQRA